MWSFEQIELEARKLLAEIEKNASSLWPNTPPSRLFMCDPEAACRLLGLNYLPDSHLGMFGNGTAGMLDRKSNSVLLSFKQTFESLRFTAAHEVGHFKLHPDQQMFRDRSLTEPGGPGRPRVEQEADYFAACFLAPPRLVRSAFQAMFAGTHLPMTNTGTICFALSPQHHQYLESLPSRSLEFAVEVARTDRFNGVGFNKSLSRLFGVSPKAMGIRLLELDLVG